MRLDARLQKTTGYYIAFIAIGLAAAAIGPTLPGLAEQTQSRLSAISYLFIARSLGYLLGSLQAGRLYDRVAGHPLMVAMLASMAAVLFLVPLLPWLWLLTAALLLLGAAEAAVDVGGNTLLVWVHGRTVSPYMNGLHFFFGLGAFLSPLIIAQAVLLSGNLLWAYWGLALLMLPAAIYLLRLPSPRAQDGSQAELSSTRTDSLLVALIGMFFFLYVGAEVSCGGWIFTYARRLNLADETTAALLTSVFWGALTLGRLLSVPLAARFQPSTILLVDLLVALGSLALILLGARSLAVVAVGTFGAGLGMASVFPTTLSLAERHMAISGQVTGWFLVGAGIGGMILPWLVGQLIEPLGAQAALLLVWVDVLLALGLYTSLMAYTKGILAEPKR